MNEEKSGHNWMRALLGMAVIAAVLWVCYVSQEIVVLLVIAILAAYALSPLVGVLKEIKLPFTRIRIGRGVASAAVVIGVLALIGVLLSNVVPAIVAQANNVLGDLPSYITRLRELVAQAQVRLGENEFLSSWLSSFEKDLGGISIESGRYIGKGLFTAVNIVMKLVGFILLPVATFYVLKDGKKLTDGLLSVVPNEWRGRAEEILRDLDRALSAYVRGLAIVCLVMATCVTIGLAAVGVNYPLVLGIFAGACEVIPFVGFIMASIAIALVGFFEDPWLALKGFLVYAAINQFLGYLVTPRVMGRRMKLHPLTVLISVMVGAKIAGFTGVVFALPAVAVGKVLLLHLFVGGKVGNGTSTIKT